LAVVLVVAANGRLSSCPAGGRGALPLGKVGAHQVAAHDVRACTAAACVLQQPGPDEGSNCPVECRLGNRLQERMAADPVRAHDVARRFGEGMRREQYIALDSAQVLETDVTLKLA